MLNFLNTIVLTSESGKKLKLTVVSIFSKVKTITSKASE